MYAMVTCQIHHVYLCHLTHLLIHGSAEGPLQVVQIIIFDIDPDQIWVPKFS